MNTKANPKEGETRSVRMEHHCSHVQSNRKHPWFPAQKAAGNVVQSCLCRGCIAVTPNSFHDESHSPLSQTHMTCSSSPDTLFVVPRCALGFYEKFVCMLTSHEMPHIKPVVKGVLHDLSCNATRDNCDNLVQPLCDVT